MRDRRWSWSAAPLALWVLLLAMSVSGCESLQRKLTRRSKQPKPAPTPIINFQDYSKAFTPLDRYRKHYLIFDYWQEDLLEALGRQPLNPKRVRIASTESLAELGALQQLLVEDAAAPLAALLEERAGFDRQLQAGLLNETQASSLRRRLEQQGRRIHREFFWRDIEDQLKEQ